MFILDDTVLTSVFFGPEWYLSPVILALRRLRQEDNKFEANLIYLVSSQNAWATRNTVSTTLGARNRAQELRAPTALPGDLDSIPSTNMAPNNSLLMSVPGD